VTPTSAHLLTTDAAGLVSRAASTRRGVIGGIEPPGR
jgi:hypothetical protein